MHRCMHFPLMSGCPRINRAPPTLLCGGVAFMFVREMCCPVVAVRPQTSVRLSWIRTGAIVPRDKSQGGKTRA